MARTLDYVGQRYGRLVIKDVLDTVARQTRVLCLCDCGREHAALLQNIKRGLTSSCGCLRKELAAARINTNPAIVAARANKLPKAWEKRNALIGSVYGRLTVVSTVEGDLHRCMCECACGKVVTPAYTALTSGSTKSCGCLRIYRHPEHDVGLRKLYYRYSTRQKNRWASELEIPLAVFATLTSSPCFYCTASPGSVMKSHSKHSEYIYNGLDRVDSSRSYTIDNVVPCCEQCNKMKLDIPQSDFLEAIHRIATYSLEVVSAEALG